MASFLLVHGAFHGGWCWDRLTPLLVGMGHQVEAPDLPGLEDGDAGSASAWLDLWTDFLAGWLDGCSEPPILVGHSRAGIVISQLAERVPERLAGLVYLAALLVPDEAGMKATRAMMATSPEPLRIERQPDGLSLRADPRSVAALIYGRADEAVRADFVSRLRPEPMAGFMVAPRLSDARYGRVPRAYIECTEDRAVDIAVQRAMHAALPCDPVLTLDCDHSPYASDPAALAGALDAIARLHFGTKGHASACSAMDDPATAP